MPNVPGLQVLNDCEENQKLLKKHPNSATKRWNRYVTRAQDEVMPYPSFKEFTGFLGEESHIACNLISSFHAFKQAEGSSEKILKTSESQCTGDIYQHTKSKISQDQGGSQSPQTQ